MGKYAPATMLHALCYGVFGLLLMACGASQYAPVQELGYSLTTQPVSASSVRSAPASYQVRSGDTLFAIAWRFGWDYKELAKVNAIASPYTIYVGQKLLFSECGRRSRGTPPARSPPEGSWGRRTGSARSPPVCTPRRR